MNCFVTKSKVRKTFLLKKRVYCQNFEKSIIDLNSTLKFLSEKTLKLEKNSKLIFWQIFFFFFFFFKKTFLISIFLKNNLQILKGDIHTYSKILINLSYLIKWRAGGRPAPPASKCNKKNEGEVVSFALLQIM